MTRQTPHTHTWAPHKQALNKISTAIHTLDFKLRMIAKNAQLQPGDRARQEQQARAEAQQAVNAARAALGQAFADNREASRYADIPTGETLTRRVYYQRAAMTDMQGLTAAQAVTVVRQVVDSGDMERAREYIRAARPLVRASEWAVELKAAELEAMAPEERAHRIYAAGVSAAEAQLPALDQYTAQLLDGAGRMSEAERQGWQDAGPMDTRLLSLWWESAERHADAGGEVARAGLEGREPGLWARHPERPFEEAGNAPGAAEPGQASQDGEGGGS